MRRNCGGHVDQHSGEDQKTLRGKFSFGKSLRLRLGSDGFYQSPNCTGVLKEGFQALDARASSDAVTDQQCTLSHQEGFMEIWLFLCEVLAVTGQYMTTVAQAALGCFAANLTAFDLYS